MNKRIATLIASTGLAVLLLATSASAADLDAPYAKWVGHTYARSIVKSPSRDTGKVMVRFWNARHTGELKLGLLRATIPYQCNGEVHRKVEFEYDEREDGGADDVKVWMENDYGVKMIHFKLLVDRVNWGGKFVWVVGSAKYSGFYSNDSEPDASGRIASYMKDCRSVGGVGFPLGWRADRTDLTPDD